MSYYTHFGAYVEPDEIKGFSDDLAAISSEFHGSSRSAAFQVACKRLLDAAPGHDLLRCLSNEVATREVIDGDGVTAFTRIVPDIAASYLIQLDELAVHCGKRGDEVAILWMDQLGGYSTAEVALALANVKACRNLNQEAYHGEDGDTPFFAFAVLASLRATVARVCSTGGKTLVYYTWRPT